MALAVATVVLAVAAKNLLMMTPEAVMAPAVEAALVAPVLVVVAMAVREE